MIRIRVIVSRGYTSLGVESEARLSNKEDIERFFTKQLQLANAVCDIEDWFKENIPIKKQG